MKIIKDIKLHFITVIMFGVLFPILFVAIGLLFPAKSKGLPIIQNNKLIGYENIGQNFYSDKYFWGRPSAVGYDAKISGASNKGASNKEYLNEVEKRINEFLYKNPSVSRNEIPSELVTASGSGLDPHISPNAAKIQIERISKTRNLAKENIMKLLNQNIEKPFLGIFGPQKVNVLKLNIALDKLDN